MNHLRQRIDQDKNLIMYLVITLVVKIPRVPSITGNDAFVVIWMGRIITERIFQHLAIKPSITNWFVSVCYISIGLPGLLAVLTALGISIEFAVLIITCITAIPMLGIKAAGIALVLQSLTILILLVRPG